MEPSHHSEAQNLGPNGKAEKLPIGKLHSVQYLIALVLAVLLAGLWRLQVLNAENFRSLAEANRIRKVPILAPRGKLFDREGRLLVDNYPSVSCYLLREQVKDLDADLPLISQGLHISLEQIQSTLRRYEIAPKYQPIPLKQDISPDEQAFIAAHRDELPELETLDEQRRLYPSGGFAAHLIGYVGEVSEQMLNDPRYAFYSSGDVVGRSGVEQTYDALLRGVDGSRDVIVNSHGKELGHLGQELATPGKDLKLTIDLDIQMAAEKAMEGKNGALVAMDPHTGEILAMVSRPTFDPNQFAVRLTRTYWNQIITDPNHPLLNKTIQAQLAPGSTFKIIMSLAGLEEGVAQDMHVVCNGGGTYYGHFFACDKHHGMVDIDDIDHAVVLVAGEEVTVVRAATVAHDVHVLRDALFQARERHDDLERRAGRELRLDGLVQEGMVRVGDDLVPVGAGEADGELVGIEGRARDHGEDLTGVRIHGD